MRGQITILGLIMTFIALVFLTGMLPALQDIITTGLATGDDFTDKVLMLFIPVMFIGVLYSFWVYVTPNRPQPPGYY